MEPCQVLGFAVGLVLTGNNNHARNITDECTIMQQTHHVCHFALKGTARASLTGN